MSFEAGNDTGDRYPVQFPELFHERKVNAMEERLRSVELGLLARNTDMIGTKAFETKTDI